MFPGFPCSWIWSCDQVLAKGVWTEVIWFNFWVVLLEVDEWAISYPFFSSLGWNVCRPSSTIWLKVTLSEWQSNELDPGSLSPLSCHPSRGLNNWTFYLKKDVYVRDKLLSRLSFCNFGFCQIIEKVALSLRFVSCYKLVCISWEMMPQGQKSLKNLLAK